MDNPILEAKISMEKVKGDIVTGTLDTLNTGKKKTSCKGKDQVVQSYEFNKSVLEAAYDAKGIVINSKS